MRKLPLILTVLVAVLIGTGVYQLSFRYFQSQEITTAEGRLSLYRSTVVAELERFSHLPFVLARDPFVIETAEMRAPEALNDRLARFADKAGLDAIYLMGLDGVTIAASNAALPSSFVGQDYGFRPYFKEAIEGGRGRFYGIGATTGLPGYFLADPVLNGAGATLGAVAVKLDLSGLQNSWRASGEQVLLANQDGVVLLASDPAWQYRTLRPLSPAQRQDIEASRQFPGQGLDILDWEPSDEDSALIDGTHRLHLTANDLPHDWALHYFSSDSRAVVQSWLVTVGLGVVAGTILILFQIQRTRRMATALGRSEQEEALLRSANERLAIEIEERRNAERRLKRTQSELEQTSRLAALGQLAASVTHELGQPIAAMRNHLAAAEISASGPQPMTGKIAALVERMEGITRQLKFFARTDQEEFGPVDLDEALQAALSLVAINIERSGAELQLSIPTAPVVVRGNRLRIEQVLTNLLRNALDASEDTDKPALWVSLGASDGLAWCEVQDNGHGLGTATLAELRQPFVTTRESGRGMGLGLAISSTIVSDHGGAMRAWNAPETGAVFRVEFPVPDTEGNKA